MHDVDSALDLLCGRDLTTGRQVSAAWRGLSGGDAAYRASQFDVQRYLWLILPRQVRAGEPADWRPVAEAFASFFDLTGEPRYAEICRGSWTERVLAAAADQDRCAQLAISAMEESGVLPPDELEIAWLNEPGPYEAAAFDAIARALEAAIEDGQIPLNAPVADELRLMLAVDLLNSRLADEGRRTVAQAMVSERIRYWAKETPSSALRELLVRTEPDIASEPSTDIDPGAAVAPLRLLLESARHSPRLTKAGYLPTDLVARIVEVMPYARTFPGSGRSESAWPPVGRLRDLAYRCELIDVEDGRLKLTYLGEDALEDDRTLLNAVCARLIGGTEPEFRQQVLETVLMMMLMETHVDRSAIDRRLGVVLEEFGWRRGVGADDESEPLSHAEILELRVEALWDLRVLDALVDEDVERPVGLNELGREVALAAMRARVMQGWWWG